MHQGCVNVLAVIVLFKAQDITDLEPAMVTVENRKEKGYVKERVFKKGPKALVGNKGYQKFLKMAKDSTFI
jgi:hypothetical protein